MTIQILLEIESQSLKKDIKEGLQNINTKCKSGY